VRTASWFLAITGFCFISLSGHSLGQAFARAWGEESKPPLLYPVRTNQPAANDRTFAAATSSDPSSPPEADKEPEFEEPAGIPDPLEPLNRIAYHVNDKLYFWVLKPVATGYKYVFPESFRVGVGNFFSNFTTPIRFVNCLLQAKFKAAGNEAARFGINTTLGFLGFVDQANDKFDIKKQDEDLGQTFGFWGVEPGFYIEWIFFGPSSLRDTFGFAGDLFLDARTYITDPIIYLFRPVEVVNEVSLRIGDYEDLKQAAIDPYVAKRDAYSQYRQNKIKE
jgi:phospholipid-binding lipoprotein MlaA